MDYVLAVHIDRERTIEAYKDGRGLDHIINKTKEYVEEFQHDMTTIAGRKRTASLAHKVSKQKVYLDDLGKTLVADWKAKAKVVDLARKSMRDQHDELKREARRPLDEWEEAEGSRIGNISKRIVRIKELGETSDWTGDFKVSFLQEQLTKLANISIDESFQEFANEAALVKDRTIRELKATITDRENYEAGQAALALLREEKKAREKTEYEGRLKAEAAEQTRRDVEEEIRQEQEALRREKQEAVEREERAKQAAEEAKQRQLEAEQRAEEAAENARLAEINRRKEEEANKRIIEEKKAANKRHRGYVRNKAANALIALGVDEQTVIKIIAAIQENKIPGVTINF